MMQTNYLPFSSRSYGISQRPSAPESTNAIPENESAVTSLDAVSIPDNQKTTTTVKALPNDLSFETIANRIAGTLQTLTTIWEACDAYFHQGEVISHEELAETILDQADTWIEEQQFAKMLASGAESATFFNDAKIQAMIIKAWCNGMKIDSRFFAGLQGCTKNLSSDCQDNLVHHLLKLLDKSLLSSREITRCFTLFSDIKIESSVQKRIAKAIGEGRFGKEPDALKAIVGKLAIFTDEEAQRMIAWAIKVQILGTDPNILQAVAENLTIFNDEIAQRVITGAILFGDFGTDSTVLGIVAQKLDHFTDSIARQNIALAIANGTFGTNFSFKKTSPLPSKGATFFNDSAIQLMIVKAWCDGMKIDSRFFEGLQHCKPQLRLDYQEKFVNRLLDLLSHEGSKGVPKEAIIVCFHLLTWHLKFYTSDRIASGIIAGRFGTDPDVLEAIAQKLAFITAGYSIAKKDLVGIMRILGTYPKILLIALNKLDFTNSSLQEEICLAIQKDEFCTDLDVLQAVIPKLTILKSVISKQNLGQIIQEGGLGTNPVVSFVVVKNSEFIDPAEQRFIALAMQNGKFGTDPTVLKTVAQHLNIFTDPEAQRFIALAISNGKFGTEPAVLQVVAQNLTIFTDTEAQRTLARAIRNDKFGTDTAVLQVVVQNLKIFTDPEAQQALVGAIDAGIFGWNLDVLKAVAQHLNIFTDPKAQRRLAVAIDDGIFGRNLDVLKEVAQNLIIFTDTEAQRTLARAISNGKFGTEPAVLQVVAQNLTIFTDTEAQRTLARAISNGKFGRNLDVLKEVAQKLTIFSDRIAQRVIVEAIRYDVFCTNAKVLQAVAQNLTIFTDTEAQRTLALAISNSTFGTNPTVLLAVAQNLRIFIDPDAQQTIGLAITRGRFGRDSNVLKAILRVVPHLLSPQTMIDMLPHMTLLSIEEIKILIERLRGVKLSLDLEGHTNLGLPEQHLLKLFGAKAYLGSEIKALLSAHFSKGTVDDSIDFVCEDAVEYAIQIHHQQLILYPLTSHQDKADFIGWMSQEYGYLYEKCVTNIRIFDFAQLQGGYPTLTTGENLSPAHTIFATLPAYLQQAIWDNRFNISKFQHRNVIRFVTQTLMVPLMARNAELANKMLDIMQSSIVTQGGYVTIAQTDREDMAIKNEIGKLCHTKEIRELSTKAVDTFLASLTPEEEQTVLPRLAVLLGTMAKQGVLGYHYDGISQANELLYLLASHCFHKLQGTAGIAFPVNFHQDLDQGICIEVLTNIFVRVNNNAFSDVFATR